jgi:hypothetical protein
MKPGTFPLNLYRGDTGRWRFQLWEDIDKTIPTDLTGVTVLAQISDTPGGLMLAPLGCTVVLPNVIEMVLLATDSAGLPVDGGCLSPTSAVGVWDLELTYAVGDVLTLLAGPVSDG